MDQSIAPAPTRRFAEPLGYLVGVTLTLLILGTGLRLDHADFHAPFAYEYDALLILPMVKETVETGTHWRTERLGAPGIQELHDFPVIDHLHFAVIWLLGRIFSDPVVVFNLFHLLTYPLTVLTATFVYRRFGLTMPAAVVGGILYAFQPYHYLRGQMHYFLAAYYMIPLTLMITLWICQGRLPFFRRTDDGRYRWKLWSRDALTAIAIGAATSSAGAYYAFFACILLVAAGGYGWLTTRTWRAAASAAGVIAVIVFGGVLNHAPTFAYQLRNGQNSRPHARMAEDAERYGMKLAQLILPIAQHNPIGIGDDVWFDPAAIRSQYQSPLFKELNEADWDSLGLIGAVGYLMLLGAAVVPIRRTWPIGPLAALTVFGTLVGTIGGFGSVFNTLISAQVRCYNRISIYLAFFALFAVLWLVDRYFATRQGRVRFLRWPTYLGLGLFGIWDQTNDQWFPDIRMDRPGNALVTGQREKAAEQYYADRAFFARIEEQLPGGMVFTYPHMPYPETPPYFESGKTEKIESYDMVIGYLHTRTVRWNFGAMKGREVDSWLREVTGAEPVPRMLERIALAGFEGLLVDSRGINPKRFHELKLGIEQYLGAGAFREFHADRRLYFFDLRGYRESLKRNYGPARFEAMAKAELEGFVVLWLKGFASYEPNGYEWRSHWCGKSGQVVLLNRSERTITAEVRMRFRTAFQSDAKLTIAGGAVWSDELTIGSEEKPPEYVRTIVIPPGRHVIGFTCRPNVSILPNDSRNELYSINNFKLIEVR